ncbi:MAG: hypothetical protein ACRDSZ_12445 [Pseudonocardiaceae bacterium]
MSSWPAAQALTAGIATVESQHGTIGAAPELRRSAEVLPGVVPNGLSNNGGPRGCRSGLSRKILAGDWRPL